MIGEQQFEIELVSKTGLRYTTEVTVTYTMSPEQVTVYEFTLVTTADVLKTWGITEDRIERGLLPLVEEMYDGSVGLKRTAPQFGYWFDEGNATETIHGTVDLMRNGNRSWFLQNPAEDDHIADIFGGSILTEVEQLDQQFAAKAGQHLLHKPDRAYIRSRIVRDLSTAPQNETELLSRVEGLNVIMDSFGVEIPGTIASGSLNKLYEWLTTKVGATKARELTTTFYHLRGLRNQYPNHFQYAKQGTTESVERKEVRTAEEFFGFRDIDDNPTKWKKICDRFKQALQDISTIL